jgi:hypothetical protein
LGRWLFLVVVVVVRFHSRDVAASWSDETSIFKFRVDGYDLVMEEKRKKKKKKPTQQLPIQTQPEPKTKNKKQKTKNKNTFKLVIIVHFITGIYNNSQAITPQLTSVMMTHRTHVWLWQEPSKQPPACCNRLRKKNRF